MSPEPLGDVMIHCSICGGTEFEDRPVLWPGLIFEWELSSSEVTYINRQQGRTCVSCGGNLRTMVLCKALLAAWDAEGPLASFVEQARARTIDILDLNGAAGIGNLLASLPGYRLASYPQEDIQSLSYADKSFDVVLHSDTLEHVPNPVKGLQECYRVLRVGGLLAYTVPIIIGRLSRRRDGLIPSYHGDPSQGGEDFRVQTEYGADAWCQVLKAGFDHVTLTALDFPAAHAMSARRSR
ncbi:class I SAM-dependent methyltransferase [Aureimonas altamirensis]|uniref:class I SAM-dependent methyltransferase n=1 Tax=Aureimonas altamirensis TaxID=370622 RepID=UPI00203694DE|nr:class I SAM-dependent methyltransferase [Aureimonas altamirensis]MCM2505782.1 class I SAM-dependent methyltransferase [Aureimonas altamirensis]